MLLHDRVSCHLPPLLITDSVEDDGKISGIYQKEMEESISVLKRMCESINANIVRVEERRVSRRPELYAAEICVRAASMPATESRRPVKVAFIGPSDSGKSTLIGALCSGCLDNGSGSVRLSLLRHRHEVISGRTSSVAVEFLPFDTTTKQPIRHDLDSTELIPLIKQKQLLGAGRLAQFIDVAGDTRYQKTTFSALTSWAAPDWIAIVIPATDFDKSDVLRDLFTLVLGLEIPFFVIITKIDLVNGAKILKATGDIPVFISELRKSIFGVNIPPYSVSLFKVSNVTGEGIEVLTNHFYRLHPRRNLRLMNYLLDQFPNVSAIFCVEGVQDVPDVGTVLSGTIVHGSVELEDKCLSCWIGPLSAGSEDDHQSGRFEPINVTSAHRMRLPVRNISAGQMATLALGGLENSSVLNELDKGLILVFCKEPSTVCANFEITHSIEADVIGCTAEQANSVTEPIQGVLYWMGNKWTAQLISLQVFYLESKMRALFKIMDNKASILPGTRIIFVGPHFRLQGLVYVPLISND
jgi:GTPase